MSFTPKAMKQVVSMLRARAEKEAPRAGMKQVDLRYQADVLMQVEEVIQWLTENEAVVTKAAKGDVPWRNSKSK